MNFPGFEVGIQNNNSGLVTCLNLYLGNFYFHPSTFTMNLMVAKQLIYHVKIPVLHSVKLLSCVRLFATPWTVAYQLPLSRGSSRQAYWSGVPLPYYTTYAKWHLSHYYGTILRKSVWKGTGHNIQLQVQSNSSWV